jgi:hypothetical protein
MSIVTASLSDTLPSTVPLLDASGSNWAIFVFRFQDAVEAKGFWDHFDGSSSRPIAANATPMAAETVAMAQWDKDERSARSLLTQKLPDSTVVLVHGKKTVRERWEAVVREFSRKSAYAQADLRAKFMGTQCPERGNPREFLEGLWMMKEEMVQAGVVVDEKDYFSVIISSLPIALSNFASNQLAAAQFLSSRSMTPDDLLSMLVEESDRQRAQRQRRRGSGKGKDEESDGEALAAGNVKPKRNRANVTCWTCNKVGHYSYECEEPSEPDDEPKDQETSKDDANDATAATTESDDEYGGAWAAEEVEEEVNWFEMAIAEMDRDAKLVVKDVPMRDWFYDVVEGENELKDEGAGSKDTVVEGFGKDVSQEAIVEDSSTIGHVRPCCDDIGTGTLPSTTLGSITPVPDLEGEYEDGGTICETSSGMEPDLGVLGNPWIDDATMEWSNHVIVLRASAEVVSHSLDGSKGEGGYCRQPKGGIDIPGLQVDESCDVGVIMVTEDLKEPEMDSAICKDDPSVPRFEGEEDGRCETMDLLVAECPPSPIESPAVEVFDRAPKSMFGRVAEAPPSVLNPLVNCAKIVGSLEIRYDASTTHIPRFEPFSVGGTYEQGQGGVESVKGNGRLTFISTVHLERPPGNVFMFVEPPTVKIFDPGDFAPKLSHEKAKELPQSITSLPVGCVKDFEGAETHHGEWVVPFFLFSRFEPFLAIWTYGRVEVDMERLYRGGGLTLDDIAHLLRPPGWVIERRWLKNEALLSSLISIVDACHMVLAHQVISVFGALDAGALVSV